jgi:branched-chain amino acid transport system permease protein
MSQRTLLALGIVLLVVLIGGFFLPQWAMFIVTIAIARGLVALGLALLLRAGLVSFGQSL